MVSNTRQTFNLYILKILFGSLTIIVCFFYVVMILGDHNQSAYRNVCKIGGGFAYTNNLGSD